MKYDIKTRKDDGRKYVLVDSGRRNAKNKIIYIPVYGKTEKDFNEGVKRVEQEAALHLVSDKKVPTIDSWAAQWFEKLKADPDYSPCTYYSYLHVYNKHISPVLGFKKIRDVTRIELETAFLKIKQHSLVSSSMAQKIIKPIFKEAKIEKLIEEDISDRLSTGNIIHTERHPINDMERYAYTEAIKNDILKPLDRLALDLFILCGMRFGEVMGLKFSKFHEGHILIDWQVAYADRRHAFPKKPKSSSGIRDIEILYDEVEQAFAAVRLENPTIKDSYIFGNGDTPPSYKRGRCMWERICKKLGWKGIYPHRLRHTFISDMHDAGVDVKFVQVYVGHKDISTTLNIYTHLDRLKSAVATKALMKEYMEKKNLQIKNALPENANLSNGLSADKQKSE